MYILIFKYLNTIYFKYLYIYRKYFLYLYKLFSLGNKDYLKTNVLPNKAAHSCQHTRVFISNETYEMGANRKVACSPSCRAVDSHTPLTC